MKKDWVDTLEERVQGVKRRIEETARRVADVRPAPAKGPKRPPEPNAMQATQTGLPATQEQLPVVARMVVEIRSDGTRTVARGALEDVVTGERVQLEASGSSPVQLAASLASSLLSTPYHLGRAAGAFMRGRLGRGGGKT